jgi:hypothetical protein
VRRTAAAASWWAGRSFSGSRCWTYLLNWGIKTVDKVDYRRVRAEAIAFTEMILRLGRAPADQLATYTLT